MSDSARRKCVKEQMGWRLNMVETNARAIASHFDIFKIEGEEAANLRKGLDKIVETVRARYKEAVKGGEQAGD